MANQKTPTPIAQKPETPQTDNLKETIRIRAGILQQKFSRDVDFDREGESETNIKILRSTMERSITQMIEHLKPVKTVYQMRDTGRATSEVAGIIGMTMLYNDKERKTMINYRAWRTREEIIYEIHGETKKVTRREWPHDTDIEIIMDELTIEVTNLLINIIPS